MPVYKAPVADMRFFLEKVLDLPAYAHLPVFANVAGDTLEAILTEGARLCEEVLFPLNKSGDDEGCTRHADGSVTTPAGFKAAFQTYREGGWMAMNAPEAYGGMDMPHILGTALEEYRMAANQAFSMYPGLTMGAVAAILATGSEEQKSLYVPRMISGEWAGTMNLTEPHCGTDLGLIRTRAEPQADGSYAISGTKIFISGGDQDLTDNIIHLVLAKTPGAPESSKGISLFIVPKFLVNADGSLGARNGVSCGSIEHKMGIRANATCVLNYDGATGYLVGEENKGLAGMFVMMNAARLGVGAQGLSQGEVAYQNGVAYALDRRQGRALTGPADPAQKADAIFVHPDVRRMLMEAKVLTEGLRGLCLWGSLQADLAHGAETEEERTAADDLLGLLTPVIKAYCTDMGYRIATDMQQVFGGHGYIEEQGMSQYVRDARITMIYEGTNGVQAMDLVGRKLASKGGRAVQAFFAMAAAEIAAAKGDDALADIGARLEKSLGDMQAATMWLMQNAMANPDNAGAGATAYLHITGAVVTGLMWLKMARTAQAELARGGGDTRFLAAKLVSARFYAERILPETGAHRRKLEAGAATLMTLTAEDFATA